MNFSRLSNENKNKMILNLAEKATRNNPWNYAHVLSNIENQMGHKVSFRPNIKTKLRGQLFKKYKPLHWHIKKYKNNFNYNSFSKLSNNNKHFIILRATNNATRLRPWNYAHVVGNIKNRTGMEPRMSRKTALLKLKHRSRVRLTPITRRN